MWQWCVSRSSKAVVIFASPKTLAHSEKLRLVVMITLVRSYRRNDLAQAYPIARGSSPLLVTLGAALLGWIAGGLIVNDPAGDRWPILDTPLAEYGMSIAGALFVVILGYLLKRRNASRAAA